MEKKASRSKFLIPFYIAFAVTVCAAAGGMLFLTAGDERPVHRFILPKGFTGWVEVVYEQPGYPALKKEGRSFVYEVPSSGKIATSSRNASGPMELYYAEQDGRRIELPTDVPTVHGRFIRGKRRT
ncbi:DUF6843 domain-containing protein [Paenibacillus thailandensis]|uniref:DUF6843 domain-containing protein n=1 Tax=Paenibacillus thailandensis TaxID=393250 RepID=A0ABW5QY82_9BACL